MGHCFIIPDMQIYWHIYKLAFQRQITYRTANLAGLLTNLFFGLIRAAVLIALYGARREENGITLQGAVTYTGITQALIAYLSLFGWWDVMKSVYQGAIAADLLKPVDYFSFWLAQDLGRATASFLLRGLPLIVGYAIFYPISYPTTAGQWVALAIALILSMLTSFAWRFLVNLASFWSPNALGFGRFAFGLSWFFSGFIMPLRFFPDWFITIANLTPFPSMINTVSEIWLGVIHGQEMIQALVVQAAWFIGLAIISQLVLRAGIRTLVIQGG